MESSRYVVFIIWQAVAMAVIVIAMTQPPLSDTHLHSYQRSVPITSCALNLIKLLLYIKQPLATGMCLPGRTTPTRTNQPGLTVASACSPITLFTLVINNTSSLLCSNRWSCLLFYSLFLLAGSQLTVVRHQY